MPVAALRHIPVQRLRKLERTAKSKIQIDTQASADGLGAIAPAFPAQERPALPGLSAIGEGIELKLNRARMRPRWQHRRIAQFGRAHDAGVAQNLAVVESAAKHFPAIAALLR